MPLAPSPSLSLSCKQRYLCRPKKQLLRYLNDATSCFLYLPFGSDDVEDRRGNLYMNDEHYNALRGTIVACEPCIMTFCQGLTQASSLWRCGLTSFDQSSTPATTRALLLHIHHWRTPLYTSDTPTSNRCAEDVKDYLRPYDFLDVEARGPAATYIPASDGCVGRLRHLNGGIAGLSAVINIDTPPLFITDGMNFADLVIYRYVSVPSR